MKARIVYVALLGSDDQDIEIADAVNEMIRPAVHDWTRSGILDYGFNSDGNCPALPPSVPVDVPDDYDPVESPDDSWLKKIKPYIGNANL